MGSPAGAISRQRMSEPHQSTDGVVRVMDRVVTARDGMVPEENSGPGPDGQYATEPGTPHETPSGAVGTISQLTRGAERLSLALRVQELRAQGLM